MERFHLVGSSLGSLVAQRCALARPARVRSLALLSTYAEPGLFSSRLFAGWTEVLPVLGVQFVLRDFLLRAFSPQWCREHEDELEQFEAGMRASTTTTDGFAAQLAAAAHDTTAELARVDAPTLVLAGEHDVIVPTGSSHDVHEMIPGSEWATVAGGHGCVWESAAQVNEVLVGFLGRHSGPAPTTPPAP